MSKVPVIVMSGFLGSGKTTLLFRLLQEAAHFNLLPAVLMNELGKQDVDGHLLQEASPNLNLAKLLDGCICCSKKSDISDSIKQLLLRKPDVILIELTGVANPEEIVDALTEPALIPLVKLHKVVTVLDAENVRDYNSIFATDRELVHTLRRQIEVADLLILNKIDLITDKKQKSIVKAIRKYNERSLLLPTAHSKFDLNLLLGALQPRQDQHNQSTTFNRNLLFQKHLKSAKESTTPVASYSRIQSISIPIESELIMNQRFIERFLIDWGSKLIRAKGYLSIGVKYERLNMQFAGKRINWQPTSFQGNPYLVLIGLDLDVSALEEDWKRRIIELDVHTL
ncbi:GTP-binding protein [Paenibacillus sp. LMG 31461]|uniref:GTP-binding protein n=1 Tax=Paenibacillus plantarum TaxID=2654975 RepID=A0ABX1XKA0_9BACL|nr:CobW family GTP-binding protein [Paenibacillus plantarum]NOU68861.1 GTP-binding protein [Paenibacillus plantarum]